MKGNATFALTAANFRATNIIFSNVYAQNKLYGVQTLKQFVSPLNYNILSDGAWGGKNARVSDVFMFYKYNAGNKYGTIEGQIFIEIPRWIISFKKHMNGFK